MRKQILKPWQEMPIKYRMEVYDAYAASVDEPQSFEDFDAAMHNTIAAAIRRLYIRA